HHHLPANDTGHALVHVDHRALLDVGIVADHHPVVVGADHHIEPDAHPPPDLDGPDHGGTGGDVVFTEHCHGAVTKAVLHSNGLSGWTLCKVNSSPVLGVHHVAWLRQVRLLATREGMAIGSGVSGLHKPT